MTPTPANAIDAHAEQLGESLRRNRLSRRQALWLFSASTAGAALGLQGCAESPVSGKRIVVGMSEAQERAVDAEVAGHQFSQDLGAIQDGPVNQYIAGLGQDLHRISHRPDMPYSYRVLNANYVNAYTFPGGAMGVTRGILVELENEAQLAALLGHELGHVNARHAAQRQGQGMLAQLAVVGLSVASQGTQWADLAGLGGQLGASALLASYSRDNEREADALGQAYMVKAGYPAQGMSALHQMLVNQEKEQPGLLATMFSSHPMSSERLNNATELARSQYAQSARAPIQRERFMDQTASLRRLKPAITHCKNGELALGEKRYGEAQSELERATRLAPRDYAANLRLAQCFQAQNKADQARQYAAQAQAIYPQEAQAHKLSGVLALQQKNPAAALQHLNQFEQRLPGDPGVAFLRGVSLEGLGRRQEAAQLFGQFLRQNPQGNAAQYASSRLKSWGMLR